MEPKFVSGNITRRGSASPRDSKDWSHSGNTFTMVDTERRGSGTSLMEDSSTSRLIPSGRDEFEMSPATPSHDHAPALPFGRTAFPRMRGPNRPQLSDFLHSKMFRNVSLITTAVLFLLSIVHSAKPEVLGTGLGYLSNIPGLSTLAKEEIKTLDERLRDLMTRPVLDQWELETTNRYQCPMYTFSRSTYFFHDGKQPEWEAVKKEDIRRYRNKIISYLKDIEESGEPLVWTPSVGPVKRGIILTGGEGKSGKMIMITLKMLRETLGCTLPVEIYHFPDEMKDAEARKGFEDFGDVTIVELGAKHVDGKNWQIKNAAFIQSEFTEFVYMDSDNIPLMDPNEHFESVEYKNSGSVFWPDLNKDHPDNAIWRVLGHACSDEHWPAEAGQIVFDKRGNQGLNLAILHLSNHMMSNPQMYGFLSYGDKDTFRFSFYALGLHYQQASKIFASTGGFQTQNGDPSPNYFCGHSMMQWGLTPMNKRNDPTYHPKPAFLHTILAKARHGLDPNLLWSHIRRPRLDDISEPALIRTLYEWTGDCFAITLQGSEGLPTSVNSMRDGQGVLTEGIESSFGQEGVDHKVYKALQEIAPIFVKMNE